MGQPSNEIGTLDQRVLDALPGAEKIKALLRERGMELRDFAEKYNHWVETVSRCIWARRDTPAIRDDLATELSMMREEIDLLIDGPAEATP